MTYPVKEATYKHTPRFIDRMKDEENEVNTPYKQSDFDPVEPLVSNMIRKSLNRDDGGAVDNSYTPDPPEAPSNINPNPNDMLQPIAREAMAEGETPEWKVKQNYQNSFGRRSGSHRRGGRVG